MTSPPSSLAAVLDIPGVQVPTNPPPPTDVPTNDEDSAAVLSYLRENYPTHETGFNDPTFLKNPSASRSTHRTPVFTQPLPNTLPARSISPVDHSLQIDPRLTELAFSDEVRQQNQLDGNQTASVYTPVLDEYGALGEMGGKRKKAPHERAGWKAMEEMGPRKRGRKKGVQNQSEENNPNTGYGQQGGEGHMYKPIESNSSAIHAMTGHVAHEKGSDGERRAKASDSDDVKGSRAEQNRRAQQAFRRRREERMKDLESAAAALETTQRRLQDAESKFRDAALSLDASRIETAALRAALSSIVAESGQSVITADGNLAIGRSLPRRTGKSSPEEMNHAYEVLARQSRELAKRKQEPELRQKAF